MIPNRIQISDVRIQDVQSEVTNARRKFCLSKESASWAAAHTYMVWRQTMASDAPKEAQDYILKEIEKTNTALKAEGLPLVKARKGASRFTEIVKYVLEFHAKAQSSNVSRYAKAIEWLHAKYRSTAVEGSQIYFEAIQIAGGFEAVLAVAPNSSEEYTNEEDFDVDADVLDDSDVIVSAERSKVVKYLEKQSLEALKEQKLIGQFSAASEMSEDWQLFVGRPNSGVVDILASKPTNGKELFSIFNHLLLTIAPKQKNTDFVARVLKLGELIERGVPYHRSVDGNPHSEKPKSTLGLTVRKGANGTPELVCSGRYTDVSAVIVARDKGDLLAQCGNLQSSTLLGKYLSRLERELNGSSDSVLSLGAIPEPTGQNGKPCVSQLAWEMKNLADSNAVDRLYWARLSAVKFKPLHVEERSWQAEFSIDLGAVAGSLFTSLVGYSGAKTNANPVSLNVEGGTVHLNVRNDKPVALGSAGGAHCVQLRGCHLQRLFLTLSNWQVSEVSIAIDTGGLVRFSWEDATGEYTVYLPTVDSKGALVSRRFVTIAE